VYFSSPDTDDGGFSGGGGSLQTGLIARFRFRASRVGLAVRVLNVDVQLLLGRQGVWTGSGVAYQKKRFTTVAFDFGGFLVTFP
jgi:hypothetical protein